MKKFAWIAILLALSLAFFGCPANDDDDDNGDEGDGTDITIPDGDGDGDGGEVADELVIDNPKFDGWGGLGSAGNNNTFTFKSSTQYNCRTTYKFPDEASGYAKFEITFSLTKDAVNGHPTKPMKFVFGDRSYDKWGESGDGWKADSTFNEYKDFTDDSTETKYSHAISENKQLTIEQNWGNDKDSSADFTITITKIRFYN